MKRIIPLLGFIAAMSLAIGQTPFPLAPDTLRPGAMYGRTVALEGEVAVVGTGPGIIIPPIGPYLYVFQEENGSWNPMANLVATDSGSIFFWDAAISMEEGTATIMTSHPDDDDGGNRSGAVYFFSYNLADGTWMQDAKVNGGQYTQNVSSLGTSVAVDGDWAIAGAPKYDLTQTAANPDDGAAIMFRREAGTGSWVVDTQLIASDFRQKANFGQGVGISGDYAIVGSPFQDSIGTGQAAGAAYIFERTANGWEEKQKLVPSFRSPLPIGTDNFGWAVDIQGDLAVVGAWSVVVNQTEVIGMASVFELQAGVWEEVAVLVPSDSVPSGAFGFDVSIDERGIAGIAGFSSTNGISGYVYKQDGNAWIEQSPIINTQGAGFPAISIDGDRMVLGSADDQGVTVYEGICTGGVNIEATFDNQTYTLFPNPTSNVISVKGIERSAQVAVYTIDGKRLISTELTAFQNSLQLSGLDSGHYLLMIEEGKKKTSYRIQVSR